MKPNRLRMTARPPRQRGLSLIELMVALLLSGLLVLGLVQIFSASRASYSLAQGAARVQESARFAFDSLQRDIRHAGQFGCSSDQAHFQFGGRAVRELFLRDRQDYGTVPGVANNDALRFDFSLRGYEANGSGPSQAVALSTIPVAGAAGDWSPALPASLAGLDPRPVRGSDILALRILSPESAEVLDFDVSSADPTRATVSVRSGQWAVLAAGGASGLLGIADCRSAVVFQAESVGVGSGSTLINTAVSGLNQSAFDGADVFGIGQARLHRAESYVFYVGLKSDDQPALFRARFDAQPGAPSISVRSEELVEGVENLQLMYGQDIERRAARPPLGRLGTVTTATGVNLTASGRPEIDKWLPQLAWQRVNKVQIGMAVRSTDRASTPTRTAAMSAQGTLLAPPNDGRYRSVYETNIAVRNRLTGN